MNQEVEPKQIAPCEKKILSAGGVPLFPQDVTVDLLGISIDEVNAITSSHKDIAFHTVDVGYQKGPAIRHFDTEGLLRVAMRGDSEACLEFQRWAAEMLKTYLLNPGTWETPRCNLGVDIQHLVTVKY